MKTLTRLFSMIESNDLSEKKKKWSPTHTTSTVGHIRDIPLVWRVYVWAAFLSCSPSEPSNRCAVAVKDVAFFAPCRSNHGY